MIGKLKEIILAIKPNISVDINSDTLLKEDLGFDSIELAQLTVNIEDVFDVDVFEDGLISSVGEILTKIDK